ncbi:hypothetical protein KO02_02580 [Sphingobacterium sp. ML3W]|uniref:hypothetical protein n=1 Tax=Sphingobacterium sp. ML3W TaxID=1538644 RepID=UPI0004F71ADD|nr:hypothetical protein [Sphingobacterium sp. ML3W]AIM35683.1 hypothetical protein KO02_02580 [Sphingobacterium sp. ML3W]
METELVKGNKQEEIKRNTSKVYFFIIAIAALVVTNVYFYVKFKSSGEKVYALTVEKENLEVEIDRIEAELDKMKIENVQLSPPLVEKELDARNKIVDLRAKLARKELSQSDIDYAQSTITSLKSEVAYFTLDVNRLIQENKILAEKNDLLQKEVSESSNKISDLKNSNLNLASKVNVAAALKVSNIAVYGLQEKRNKKLEIEERAKRVDKLSVNFTIADNTLAKEGKKDVFVRIIDPQGNLIVNQDGNTFYAHGEKLQFTFKDSLQFTNHGEEYTLYWTGDNKFVKGAYTVLLYSDNAIMGRSTVVLK